MLPEIAPGSTTEALAVWRLVTTTRVLRGMNATPFRAVFRLVDATVRVDAAVLVDKGTLRLN